MKNSTFNLLYKVVDISHEQNLFVSTNLSYHLIVDFNQNIFK